jgi:hypothetical protein
MRDITTRANGTKCYAINAYAEVASAIVTGATTTHLNVDMEHVDAYSSTNGQGRAWP